MRQMPATSAPRQYGGIAAHLLNIGHLELCKSVWTWAGAIGFYGFGAVLNFAAALGRFPLSA